VLGLVVDSRVSLDGVVDVLAVHFLNIVSLDLLVGKNRCITNAVNDENIIRT